MRAKTIGVLSLAMVGLQVGGLPVPASALSIGGDAEDLPRAIVEPLRRVTTIEPYVATVLSTLRMADRDRLGLDAEDVEAFETAQHAKARASRLRGFMLHDLDNDGRVDIEEIRRSLRQDSLAALRDPGDPSIVETMERSVTELMQSDLNGNGVIEFAEMRKASVEKGHKRLTDKARRARELYDLDPNDDGRLMVEELTVIARRAFEAADLDKDGFISRSERPSLSKSISSEPLLGCRLPWPAPDDQIIAVTAGKGAGLSTVTVTGSDRETSIGELVVESDGPPLYLILFAKHEMIFRFTGDVGRISRVVAIPRYTVSGPGVAVTGVPADRVSFLPAWSCGGYFESVGSDRGRKTRATIESKFERTIDAAFSVATLWRMRLPSALKEQPDVPSEAKAGIENILEARLLQSYGAGVQEVEPNDVVASGPVKRYDVLPREAGLAQLLKSGSLRWLDGGVYHIVERLPRFPAGLKGEPHVFLLAPGFPVPAGDIGNICVVAEDDGRVLLGLRNCL